MKVLPFTHKFSSDIEKLPRWLKLIVGIVVLLLGIVLITKPFNSISLMVALISVALIVEGISKFASTEKTKIAETNRYLGLLLVTAGLLMLVIPSLSIQLIAITVGVSLLASGATDIVTALRTSRENRISSVIKGIGIAIFGVLTLLWQDVAILIIAVAFSIKLLIIGISLIYNALWHKDTPEKPPHLTRVRRIASFAGAIILLGSSLLILGLSNTFRAAAPMPDAFYSYNRQLPSEPGKLLKEELFTQSMPDGVRGWRILYSTTRDDSNEIVLASAFVMAPKAISAEPQPVVAWTHGTTGFVPGCAPTVMPAPYPLSLPNTQEAVNNGWVIVGTDYPGMGTAGTQPYLIGQSEGRAALDSVRAARQIKDLRLATQTVVWGHSQGGGAALWTGSLAKSYAPDVNIMGVMAAAPATDLPALLKETEQSPTGKVMGTFALRAYSETYPDVKWSDYINPSYDLIARKFSDRCLSEKSTLVSLLQSLIIPGPIYKNDPTKGALGERLRQNIPTGKIDSPVFIAQGEADPLVLPKVQANYVAERCAAGQAIEYKTYPNKDHMSLIEDNPAFNEDLEQWTIDRFANKPAASNCI